MALVGFRTCPSCNTRVLPTADDACPACRSYRFTGAPAEMRAPSGSAPGVPGLKEQPGDRLPFPAAALRFYLFFLQPLNVVSTGFVVAMLAQTGGRVSDYVAMLLIRAARILFGWYVASSLGAFRPKAPMLLVSYGAASLAATAATTAVFLLSGHGSEAFQRTGEEFQLIVAAVALAYGGSSQELRRVCRERAR